MTLRFVYALSCFLLLLLFQLTVIYLIEIYQFARCFLSFGLFRLLISQKVIPKVFHCPFVGGWYQVRNSLLFTSKHVLFHFDVLILVVFVDFKQLLVHYLLRRAQKLSLVIVELDEQVVETLTLEINVHGVPLAVQTIVVIVLRFGRIVLLWMRHGQTQDTHANRALEQSLAFVLLTLRFAYLEHIIAELAVEVLYLFLHAKSTEAFLAFETQIHLFFDKLASTSAPVMDVRGPELCEPVHLDFIKNEMVAKLIL